MPIAVLQMLSFRLDFGQPCGAFISIGGLNVKNEIDEQRARGNGISAANLKLRA